MTPTATLIPTPPPAPVTPLMTADEFARKHGDDRMELLDGVAKEKPMPSFEHAKVVIAFGAYLFLFVKQHDLGQTGAGDPLIRLSPTLVRAPDVCFFSYERLPKGDVPKSVLTAIPDLVAEVRSPSDLWTDLLTKVIHYLTAGVKVVLVFDPASKTVSAYRNTEHQDFFKADDDLIVPDVLPGFAVRVGTLFE